MTFLPLLRTEAGNLPERILVVGDPARLELVAESLAGVEPVSRNREYHSIRGEFEGRLIGAVSHGVGSAGAGACFEELCRSGAARIVRAGSAGGLRPDTGPGDIVIASAAVREDGLSPKLAPPSYPAVATPEVFLAMRQAARAQGVQAREGLLLTSDLFYPHDLLGSDLPLWAKAGVAAVEMEAATLFVVCGLHGVETGAVVAIDGNPLAQDGGSMETYDPRREGVRDAVARSLKIALAALVS